MNINFPGKEQVPAQSDAFYAHTDPSTLDRSRWEPLFSKLHFPFDDDFKLLPNRRFSKGHLNKVAALCSEFAKSMFASTDINSELAGQWGEIAGLWHDLGKFAPEWQQYLASKADPHSAEIKGTIDHSTAGARHAVSRASILGHILAYPISGHHSGLLDAASNGACLADRLRKDLPDFSSAPPELLNLSVPSLPDFLRDRDEFALGFFTRMLFSCLVDADFLATESFMNPDQFSLRNQSPQSALSRICELVDARIKAFPVPDSDDSVNLQRHTVVENCRAAATKPQGLFTLTVPTGGGKTLSSLAFALRHALKNGQRRVIYVAPFTSIIEQNAEVIRKIVAPLATDSFEPLIEHHTALDPDIENSRTRLASENWDAPIIITTAVQFYESLFAVKTSRARKVHNIANSVIILDEAQNLPVDFLAPTLRTLQELSDHYNTTVVLCTATQPAISHNPVDFPIGLKDCREIIQDTGSLFTALRRVEVDNLGDLADADLAVRLASHNQTLCIVNRRAHAQKIFRLLGGAEGNFHLSALMCPEHRSRTLAEIRSRLDADLPTRVVSTQLIEAGVDVDFPIVYRALSGLDSIAQAAGRCNRHGKRLNLGKTFVFRPEDQTAEAFVRETAQITQQLLDLHPDLLGEKAIRHYFDLYYYRQKSRWDSRQILQDFRIDNNLALPFRFQFAEAAEKFRLIDDWQIPILVPYDAKARELIEKLRNPAIPLQRSLLRALQRYTIQIPPRTRDENIHSLESLRSGEFFALISMDLHYSQSFGLLFDTSHSSSQLLICES